MVPIPQTLSIKGRNCVRGIKTVKCATHPLCLIPTESTRSRCSLETQPGRLFFRKKKEAEIPFPSRHTLPLPLTLAGHRHDISSQYRVSSLPNPCASVTETVSAISYQRRRKLATFPRLHNEKQGDVQDRHRVPGSDALRSSGSDDMQPTGRDRPCARFSKYLLILRSVFLKYTKTHCPTTR